MNNLEIHQTPSTPMVRADNEQGRVFMAGDSYPENPFEFFQPIIDWIDDFLKNDDRPLAFDLQLIYSTFGVVSKVAEKEIYRE